MRASGTDLALACPYSLIAPKHLLPRRKKTADANDLGTLAHHWKETGETKHPDIAQEHTDVLDRKLFLTDVDREHWWPSGQGTHEVTFAFNAFTLELVMFRGRRGAADAWKKGKRWDPRRWVTGTMDWFGRRGRRRWVDDFKAGAWPVDVEKSGQLRTYAIVPWLLDGQPDDWECDVSITQWSKYPLAAGPVRTWHVLDSWDIQEHLSDIRWALSNTHVVRPVSYGPPQKNERGHYDFGGKLPHCAGCEAREPVPYWSELMSGSFWYRTLPHCTAGMLKRIASTPS